LCKVNRKTAAYYFHRLREIVALELEAEGEALVDGEIEVDESCFGGNRKGCRGQGAAGKTPLFGLLKRGGKVYTKIIPDASSATLFPIMAHKTVPGSIVYSDG
jgi:transposase